MTKHHWLVDRLATPVKKPAISIKLVQQLARLDTFYCKWLSIIILTVFLSDFHHEILRCHVPFRDNLYWCAGNLQEGNWWRIWLLQDQDSWGRGKQLVLLLIWHCAKLVYTCSLWMNMWQCTIFLVFFGKLLQTSALIFAYSRTKQAPSSIKKNHKSIIPKCVKKTCICLCQRPCQELKKCIILDIMVDLWCNVVIMIDSWASSSRITFTLLA